MPTITFQPSGKTVEVKKNTSLIDALRLSDAKVETPCGGEGSCGKCVVRIVSGDVEAGSPGLLTREAVDEGFVLACRTRVLDSPLVVDVPEGVVHGKGKFVDADSSLVRPELFSEQCEPVALKYCVDVPAPGLEDGLSDIDRITRSLQKECGKGEFVYPLSVTRSVADALREERGKITVTSVREGNGYHVIGVEPGDCTRHHYGIAVDVGTTTVAIQLVDLSTGEVLATKSDYNDQIDCGLDVISRINYARKPERMDELRVRILKTINLLLQKVSGAHGIGPEAICNIAVSGNTTMVHLLLGLKPEYIRLDPYTPTVLKTPRLTAGEIGIGIKPESLVHISPAVGSYVGGDITAGILFTDIARDTEDVSLFMDIGTNGELVLGNRDFLLTCACSAGPAFEGGGIECGMRAADGAIERVEIDPETGIAAYRTIGDMMPAGICGSGMITLLANLFLTGWIDPAGKLNRDRKSRAITAVGRRAHYTIVPAGESATGKPVTVSEADFGNIIRTKAAIYSAASLMLEKAGLGFSDLANVYIAGGFGRFLDLESAVVIGMVPDLPREKFKYLGNSSLAGTRMVLVSEKHRQKQMELAGRMTYLELNTAPDYMDQYSSALFLPHTDMDRFPSVRHLVGTKL